MTRARHGGKRKPCQFPKAPLGPVARHGVSNFFGTGEPDAGWPVIFAVSNLQQEGMGWYAFAARRCKEITALLQDLQAQ